VSASTYGSVGVLPGLGAFLLLSCSAFGATAHDEAHDAFMAFPPYTRTGEGGAPQLGGVVRNPAGWAFA
jgi:hypothetical protein